MHSWSDLLFFLQRFSWDRNARWADDETKAKAFFFVCNPLTNESKFSFSFNLMQFSIDDNDNTIITFLQIWMKTWLLRVSCFHTIHSPFSGLFLFHSPHHWALFSFLSAVVKCITTHCCWFAGKTKAVVSYSNRSNNKQTK